MLRLAYYGRIFSVQCLYTLLYTMLNKIIQKNSQNCNIIFNLAFFQLLPRRRTQDSTSWVMMGTLMIY